MLPGSHALWALLLPCCPHLPPHTHVCLVLYQGAELPSQGLYSTVAHLEHPPVELGPLAALHSQGQLSRGSEQPPPRAGVLPQLCYSQRSHFFDFELQKRGASVLPAHGKQLVTTG